MQATEVRRPRGRATGTIIEGSLTHEVMLMEVGDVLLKHEKGAHTRVNLATAIKSTGRQEPGREYTMAKCVGFVMSASGSPEGRNFAFYRIERTK